VVRSFWCKRAKLGRLGSISGRWVLLEHWIKGGKRRRRLSITSRSCGGAPARRRAREEEGQYKCGCVNARESALGAQGCASSRGEGIASESCCCQAGGWRGSSGRRRRDVEERGEGQRGPGSGERGVGAARGAKKGGAGVAGAWETVGEGGGAAGTSRNRAGEAGG
jgi:hypothetical protein